MSARRRHSSGDRLLDAGDRRPDRGDRRPDRGDRRPDRGDRRPGTDDRPPDPGSERIDPGDRRLDSGSRRFGAGDRSLRAGSRRLRASTLNALPAVLLLLALIGLWELYVDLGGVSSGVLPAPHAIASEAFRHPGILSRNTLVTVKEVALGLCLAVAAGFALAVAIHLFKAVRLMVYPLAVGSQALPFVVIAPLLSFWLGFGILPKLVVIGLICFFPVAVTTVDGLGSVDADELKLLRTLDASRWQAFRFAELPAALPSVLSGARIALVVAWIAAFIAEVTSPTVGPYAGLGREAVTDMQSYNVARAGAATAVLFGCAIVCFYILSQAERRLAGWAGNRRWSGA